MIKSKGWNWKMVEGDKATIWKTPSIESFYLVNRWSSQEKKTFLEKTTTNMIQKISPIFAVNPLISKEI